jgi:divinyl protochlorophyllide a 8-vinyl-reductase
MDGGFRDGTAARIGPNAILQLLPVLDRTLGRSRRDQLLAGIDLPSPDAAMWPEAACRAAHLAVWQGCGDQAPAILTAAGQGTADYILANRIPGPAKTLIRALPSALGARLLADAITRNAWTFTGSGTFRLASRAPLTFEITDNPLNFGGHWHAAVFARLFRTLVWPKARVEAAQDGRVSRFTLHRSYAPP